MQLRVLTHTKRFPRVSQPELMIQGDGKFDCFIHRVSPFAVTMRVCCRAASKETHSRG